MSESAEAPSSRPWTASEESPFPLEDGDRTEETPTERTDDEDVPDVEQPPACDPESHSSTQEELKKDDQPESEASDPELDFLADQRKKCIKALEGSNIPPEVVEEVKSVFDQYQRVASGKAARRLESDEKIWWKLEDAEVEEDEAGETLPEEAPPAGKKSDRTAEGGQGGEGDGISELEELRQENLNLTDEREVLLQRIEDLEKDLEKMNITEESEMKEKTVGSYIREVGKLKRELDLSEERVSQGQSELRALQDRLQLREEEVAEMEAEVKRYKEDAMRQESKRRSVEAEVEKANAAMDQLRESVTRSQSTFLKTVERLTLRDDENEELKKAVRGFNNQQKCMSKYIVELRDRLEFLSKNYIQVEDDNAKLKGLYANQTETLQAIRKKSITLSNFEEKWIRRLEMVDKKFKNAEEKVKKLSDDLLLKTKEIRQYDVEKAGLNKKLHDMEREKDAATDKLHILLGVLKDKEKVSENQLQTISQLNMECINFNKVIQKQQEDIDRLNKQNNKCHDEVSRLEEDSECMAATLKSTVQHLLNSERAITRKEAEVRTMVADYNNLLMEKKALRMRLLQTHGLSKDNEYTIRYLNSVIACDKNKLDQGDDTIKKLQYKVTKLQYDYNCLKIAFKQRKLEIRKLVEEINSKEKEKGTLDSLVHKGELIRIEVIKDAERLRQDVSILKTVIQRRTAEVSLVCEKTELMGAFLSKGESQMKQRLTDIHLLKTEVLRLRAENKMLIKAVENNVNMKKEIHALQKDLSLAKHKSCTLEEQMENPMNVHRWRILKGKDPEKNKLIEENLSLRKRLLQNENKTVKLKEKLHEVEVTYENLKEKFKKSGEEQEAVLKLRVAQRAIRDRDSQIQRLGVTLRSYQFNTGELQRDMEKKLAKANECMQKYYDLKRLVDREHINKTDEELLERVPFAKSCLPESTEDLVKRVLHKPSSTKPFHGTGLALPKNGKKSPP